MTLNKENDLGRFLYAILKQLDTRSINWDQVAQDTVLRAPIKSGHAARMRYHRYRKTIGGRTPAKRSALEESSKARVAKAKKQQQQQQQQQPKPKKEDAGERVIKAESTPDLSTLASPYMGSVLGDFDENELLTPRSDAHGMLMHHPVILQNIPLFEQGGCDPANLCLRSAGPDGSQTLAVSSFDTAMLFQDFEGSDNGGQGPTPSGWDDRLNDAMEY